MFLSLRFAQRINENLREGELRNMVGPSDREGDPHAFL